MLRILEGICLWAGVTGYTVSFVLALAALVFRKDKYYAHSWLASVGALVLHTLTIAIRWVESGHAPVLWTYEHALFSSWFIALIMVLFAWRLPSVRVMGVVVAPVILLVLGYGLMSHGTATEPLPPPYKGNWLWLHVFFAWIAYSAFTVSAGSAILQLLKASGKMAWTRRLPDEKTLDDLTFRIICFGFIGLTFEMGAGALWAYGLWGRYWGWDRMETWTLVSWFIYAIYLHLRAIHGWRGQRMAWVAILGYIVMFVAFGGLAMMKGLHAPLL
ncbi:MAG: cytochrome c biogenesis protein CcsA [Deltaproteobacteria bacterium]|nr:cytochrome c biogenesis protein CcsA [Deltaproteobacteria bacterium]